MVVINKNKMPVLLADFGDFAAFGQFATGVAVVAFSIYASFTRKKIREVTEISEQLTEQTKERVVQGETMDRRFELENVLARTSRMPFFEVSGQVNPMINGYRIRLENIGTKALHMAANDEAKKLNLEIPNSCGPLGVIDIGIYSMDSQETPAMPLSFNIEFEDSSNQRFSQDVFVDSWLVFRLGAPNIIN